MVRTRAQRAKPKAGRPPLDGAAMTSAERARRYRARKRAVDPPVEPAGLVRDEAGRFVCHTQTGPGRGHHLRNYFSPSAVAQTKNNFGGITVLHFSKLLEPQNLALVMHAAHQVPPPPLFWLLVLCAIRMCHSHWRFACASRMRIRMCNSACACAFACAISHGHVHSHVRFACAFACLC